MVTVKIDETDMLNMLMDRLEYWTTDDDVKALYEGYYQSLIDGGCFEGAEFSPSLIVDNDWVNYIDVVADDELKLMYDIDDITDDRILYRDTEKGLNLVQTY